MKIPDVTPARRGRVNLRGSIPDGRNEEGMGESASERADHRRFTENAGAREERVKYLTDAATKRPEQTTNKQTKTGIRRLHGACPREPRSPSRFSNSPACPRLRRYVGCSGEKQKEYVDVNYTLCFLTRDQTIDFTCNASRYSSKPSYVVDVKLLHFDLVTLYKGSAFVY